MAIKYPRQHYAILAGGNSKYYELVLPDTTIQCLLKETSRSMMMTWPVYPITESDDDLNRLSIYRKYERAAQGIDLRNCDRAPADTMLAEEDIPLRDDDFTCLSDHRKYERAAQGIDLRTCDRDPGRMHSSDVQQMWKTIDLAWGTSSILTWWGGWAFSNPTWTLQDGRSM